MTEAEAKTKWCPFARVLMTEGPSLAATEGMPAYNRIARSYSEDLPAGRCIASGCMAWRERSQWRWADTTPPEWFDGVEPAHPMKEARISGYCGLAGAPF